MRIGVDVDGVLADFNSAYIDLCIRLSGRDLFPPRPFDIPCWNYPEHYGYTTDEVKAVWAHIKADAHFWAKLPQYSTTAADLDYLYLRERDGDDIYFVTARPGIETKYQTEGWIECRSWFTKPTVLISSAKGLIAKALELDVYIDDRAENWQDVRQTRPETKTLLMDRPWNRQLEVGSCRVTSVVGIAD